VSRAWTFAFLAASVLGGLGGIVLGKAIAETVLS
jgi:hypothetical protein